MNARNLLLSALACSLLLFMTGCGAPKAPAKPAKLEIEHFTRSKGLPEEAITSLAAFANKIWAGSQRGLFAFDSVNWQIHQRKNTNVLGSDIIEDLKVSDNTSGSLPTTAPAASMAVTGRQFIPADAPVR